MSKPNAVILEAKGLNTQPNELRVPEGSLVVAENVEITRDNVVQVSPGFQTLGGSTNMPAFEPQQLFSYGGVLYAHLDSGIWYFDSSTSKWLRKRGSFGAKLPNPRWCCYLNGHLYFTAFDAVWDVNLSTGAFSVLAGRFGVSGTADGTGDAARFAANLGGICTDGTDLFVADYSSHTIRKVTTAGVVTTLAGTAGATGTTDANGTSARFNHPLGICSDGTSLYVADSTNNVIRRVVIAAPNAVTTIAGSGVGGSVDGTGTSARFDQPAGICYLSGSLYVADQVTPRIRKVAAPLTAGAGVVTTIAGSSAGFANGTGTSAQFAAGTGLQGIVSDGTNLYVCDSGNNKLRKIAPPLTLNAGVVTTAAGAASGSADGIATAGLLTTPMGVASDGTDLLVADNGANMIRKFYMSTTYLATLTGFATVAGAGTPTPFADGIVVGPD